MITLIVSAICFHWLCDGSHPVGLWAQAWRIITDFFGACFKSSRNPKNWKLMQLSIDFLINNQTNEPSYFSSLRLSAERTRSFSGINLGPKNPKLKKSQLDFMN